MKSTIVLFIAVLGIAVPGYSQSFLTNGLMGYYPFNGNANEASGNGANGATFNVAYGQDRFGVDGAAASFIGVHLYVKVLNFFSSQPTQITYSIWFKVASQVSLTNAPFGMAIARAGRGKATDRSPRSGQVHLPMGRWAQLRERGRQEHDSRNFVAAIA
jgi:hypothetical protein